MMARLSTLAALTAIHWLSAVPLAAQCGPADSPANSCAVIANKELIISEPCVVDDVWRTRWDTPGAPAKANGAWTFGKLMASLAGYEHIDVNPLGLSNFVRFWLDHFRTTFEINGFTVASRDGLGSVSDFIADWEAVSGCGAGGVLDMKLAPFRLLAIVNRLDLRRGNGTIPIAGGEGRFVFGALDIDVKDKDPADWSPLNFTVIMEYRLLADDCADILAWADAWHTLSSYNFADHTGRYNAWLQGITDAFAGYKADSSALNGSALAQLRTNENAFDFPTELREFRLQADPYGTVFLVQTTVAQTPDNSLKGTQALADYLEDDVLAIIRREHVVPAVHNGNPLLGGSSLNQGIAWTAPDFDCTDARANFAINTCNGCHQIETHINLFHIPPRFAGQESVLSTFLTGTSDCSSIPDQGCGLFPDTGMVLRRFNEKQRRADDLCDLLTASCAGKSIFRTPNRASTVH